jgi:hypothetical protein
MAPRSNSPGATPSSDWKGAGDGRLRAAGGRGPRAVTRSLRWGEAFSSARSAPVGVRQLAPPAGVGRSWSRGEARRSRASKARLLGAHRGLLESLNASEARKSGDAARSWQCRSHPAAGALRNRSYCGVAEKANGVARPGGRGRWRTSLHRWRRRESNPLVPNRPAQRADSRAYLSPPEAHRWTHRRFFPGSRRRQLGQTRVTIGSTWAASPSS